MDNYKTIKKLVKRIEKHRAKCKCWNAGKPCFDCHYGMLTDIEYEIGERDKPLHINLIRKRDV